MTDEAARKYAQSLITKEMQYGNVGVEYGPDPVDAGSGKVQFAMTNLQTRTVLEGTDAVKNYHEIALSASRVGWLEGLSRSLLFVQRVNYTEKHGGFQVGTTALDCCRSIEL